MDIGVLVISRGLGGLTREFWAVFAENSCMLFMLCGLGELVLGQKL
jgi:hypothetical protein